MRITNKIMQNNSLYNINNNKVKEDQLNTMMSTGKKITRPSDDPVVAIRALRLRSNVTQLSQYYEKNSKDAESWLQVTADALSTVTAVLTDCVKQATKGANKDLTLDDLTTIATQLDALSKEYYSTGNVDFAGRYVFTGYRTDTQLSFSKTTTADYADINDEFKAKDVAESHRVTGKYNLDPAILNSAEDPTLESDISEITVGKIRLSYDNLDYVAVDGNNGPNYNQEPLDKAPVSQATTVSTIDLTFTSSVDGESRHIIVPVSGGTEAYTIECDGITYTAAKNADNSYTITGTKSGSPYAEINVQADGTYDDTTSTGVSSATTTKDDDSKISKVTFTPISYEGEKTVTLPLLASVEKPYTVDMNGTKVTVKTDGTVDLGNGYTATANNDGSFKITNDAGNNPQTTVQVNADGTADPNASFLETSYNKAAILKYREAMDLPATSTLAGGTIETINLTFKSSDDKNTYYACVPINDGTSYKVESNGITYEGTKNADGSYTIVCSGAVSATLQVNANGSFNKNASTGADSADTKKESRQVSTLTYTANPGDAETTVKLPILPAVDQTYDIDLGGGYTATVNSDGTFTVKNDASNNNSQEVVQVTSNGSVHSSYLETSIELKDIIYSTSSDEEIDRMYEKLADGTKTAVLNASTGEVLLNDDLSKKLAALPDLINAKTIDVIYDKKEWVNGDIRPENLFSCKYTNESNKEILYNKGTAPHDIAYDVGFAQSIVVNTTADAVFTTGVKRDVDDLNNMLNEIKQVDAIMTTLNKTLEATTDKNDQAKIKNELSAAKKAYDYLREEIQKEFEHKITSMQNNLDIANIAVTDNGTRAKRLDLINSRLMDQTTTFKALQSDNEDIDLAEAATQLTTAQVVYEASLMATGKISQTSLMNYI